MLLYIQFCGGRYDPRRKVLYCLMIVEHDSPEGRAARHLARHPESDHPRLHPVKNNLRRLLANFGYPRDPEHYAVYSYIVPANARLREEAERTIRQDIRSMMPRFTPARRRRIERRLVMSTS